MFLEISQNSQENTCARVSFLIKLQALSQNTSERLLLYLISKSVDFVFMIMFSGLLFYSRVITRTIFSLKNLVYISVSIGTFKPQIFKNVYITFYMVFIKHNSLKSDIFFNLVIISCFSGFMLFRVKAF